MRRHLLALAVVGLFGSLLASDASACCHKRKVCVTPCAAPAPCAPAPCPEPCPPPCPPPAKKCCFGGFKLFKGGLCHKKQVCAPVVYTCPQPVCASGQASPQS